jgi:hypothetical protein
MPAEGRANCVQPDKHSVSQPIPLKSHPTDLVMLSLVRMAAVVSHYDSLQWRSGRFWISRHGHCWRSLCRAPSPAAMQP